MTRDPESVARDVDQGNVSAADADRVYAVVLGADGAPEIEATEQLRTYRFVQRLRAAGLEVATLAPARSLATARIPSATST